MDRTSVLILAALLLGCPPAAPAERQPLGAAAPAVLGQAAVARWNFKTAEEAWPPLHEATTRVVDGLLRIQSKGNDPYLRVPLPKVEGPLVIRWRQRSQVAGPAVFYWGTAAQPQLAESRTVRVPLRRDDQWHDYAARIDDDQPIVLLRFDPGNEPGTIDIAGVEIVRQWFHPLAFGRIEVTGRRIHGAIHNRGRTARELEVGGKRLTAPSAGSVEFEMTAPGQSPVEAVVVEAVSAGLPPLRQCLYLHQAASDSRPEGKSVLARGGLDLRALGRDALEVCRGNRLLAVIAPLAEHEGQAIALSKEDAKDALIYRGGPVDRLVFRLVDNDEIEIDLSAKAPVVGPAIRAVGLLEQGLLAGVEHLGRGEHSSSTLDVERPEHVRFEPDPLLLTMPLAACVTDRGSIAMLWDDTGLRASYSTPNRYDGTTDHRMAIRGQRIRCRVRVGDRFPAERLEDIVFWALTRRGLPAVPPAPRTPDQQRKLCLAALEGPVRTSDGWTHVAGPKHAAWFADHASTIYRLTGALPQTPTLVPGGSHIENSAAYLLSGRAEAWVKWMDARATNVRKVQQPDGSFRYSGKFARGHFEDTASGYCALHATYLLEHAWYTGNAESLAAGLKTLEFMKRFRTPRGAQTWEIPLHTPDILASAWLVHAYVRGYELTHKDEYLALARRWAASGLPFVYQWSCQPIMAYATTPVLGATHWTAPVWIGLPVQWCGLSYAYSLALLAPYDPAFDWRKVAEGILVAAEQMQYPDGPTAGCLPDSFNLASQQRLPADINPCALVALRMRLDGQVDTLAVARQGKRVAVAPFPLRWEGDRPVAAAPPGQKCQMVVDGVALPPER